MLRIKIIESNKFALLKSGTKIQFSNLKKGDVIVGRVTHYEILDVSNKPSTTILLLKDKR